MAEQEKLYAGLEYSFCGDGGKLRAVGGVPAKYLRPPENGRREVQSGGGGP